MKPFTVKVDKQGKKIEQKIINDFQARNKVQERMAESSVLYLGAVKGMYSKQMQQRGVQMKFAAVCRTFGVDYDEVV